MFNANCRLGRTASVSQAGRLISWHRRVLVEQLNEMFPLELGAEEQATWRAEKLKTRRKILQDQKWIVLNIMVGHLTCEA